MRVTVLALLGSVLATSAAAQQSGLAEHVFYFAAGDTPQTMQEAVNAIRTVVGLTQTAYSTDARSLTIQATSADTAMAAWIFQELEAPASTQAESQVDQYPGLTSDGDQLRVFRLAHTSSLNTFQEIVNTIRVIPLLSKAFPYTATWTIVARGDEARLGQAEWLFRQLDQPPPPAGQPRAEQEFHSADENAPESRVVYFAHAGTPQGQQEIVNAVRVIPELTRVFPVMGKGALAIAGPAAPVSLAEWLFTQLDRSGPEAAAKASAVQEVRSAADVAQVFFLPASVDSQSFHDVVTSIRTATSPARVFPCTSSDAVALRGTPEQLAQAASILRSSAKF